MIPLILLSKDSKKTDEFLGDYLVKHQFSPLATFRITPIKTEISIEQVRQLKKQVYTSFAQKRAFIIDSLDRSAAEAQNALLKTLEEQTQENQFIFPVENVYGLLPTIRSRAKVITLQSSEFGVRSSELPQSLKDLAVGSKEEAFTYIQNVLLHYRTQLSSNPSVSAAIMRKSLQLQSLLQNNNLNPQLTVDSLFFFIKKQLQSNS